jgi:hypothetical protein
MVRHAHKETTYEHEQQIDFRFRQGPSDGWETQDIVAGCRR